MQTKESGKPDILPVAAVRPDHARVPVMLPRESDADMRRDGGTTARWSLEPSTSPEECTARQHLDPRPDRHRRSIAGKRCRIGTISNTSDRKGVSHESRDREEID